MEGLLEEALREKPLKERAGKPLPTLPGEPFDLTPEAIKAPWAEEPLPLMYLLDTNVLIQAAPAWPP